MKRKTWVLMNAQAGSADRWGAELHELVRQRADAVHKTNDVDLQDLLRRAQEEQVQRLVVAGGDGTFNRVVNALAPNFGALELGLVPLGTGNDLSRSLGIEPEALEEALDIAFDAEARAIDVVQIRDPQVSYFMNAAGAGISGEISANLESEDKQRWGPLAYWMTAISQIVNMEAYKVHLELDSTEFERDLFGVTIANGRYVGGGFPVAYDAILDDGLLNVLVIPELPTLEILASGINVMIDRYYRPEKVESFLSKRVRIRAVPELTFSVDGEPKTKLEASFEVMPRVLKVAASPDAEAISRPA